MPEITTDPDVHVSMNPTPVRADTFQRQAPVEGMRFPQPELVSPVPDWGRTLTAQRRFVSQSSLKRLLLGGDILIVAVAVLLASVALPGAVDSFAVRLAWSQFVTLTGLYLIEGYSLAIYRDRFSLVLRLALGLGIAATGHALALALDSYGFFPRRYLFLLTVQLVPGILIWRIVGAHWLRALLPRLRVAVVGMGAAGRELVQRLTDDERFDLVHIADDDAKKQGQRFAGQLEILSSMDLMDRMEESPVDAVIVAVGRHPEDSLLRRLVALRFVGVEVHNLASFYEVFSRRIPIQHLTQDWVAFSSRFRTAMGLEARIKRVLDVNLSLLALVLLSPLLLILALLVAVTSGRPVIFSQRRVGFHRKEFVVLKFRTMRRDAESDGRPRWASADDDRVTPFGRFLRKTHLDELPQLFNILRGDMSFVGPRPERPEFVQHLRQGIPFYDLRHMVRPGLTGWAQVKYPYGASELDARHKLEYDLYYIRHQSLGLDMRILLKTVAVSLTGKGSR